MTAFGRPSASAITVIALLAAALSGASAFLAPSSTISRGVSTARTNNYRTSIYSTPTANEVEVNVQKEGDPDSSPATSGDILSVKYAGRLASDGTQFDAGSISLKLGEGRVIQGWERGLVGARQGEVRVLRIPSELAYGSRGAGSLIPPNSDLEFDCEITSVSSGPVAEAVLALGIGANLQTFLLVALLVSFLLPVLGIGGSSTT